MEIGSLTTNIAKEIVKECKIIGTKVEENFVYNYVKLLQLDPEWDITAEKANRAMIQKVVKYCVETLKHEFNPGLVVLKMQVYFNSAFSLFDEAIANNRTNLYERLTPLANEILKIRNVSTEHEYMKFYRNVVYYVTLFSGLGNPAMQPVFKEAQAALQSIFSKEEAEEFVHNTKKERRDQLVELARLVTGIRLFNRDCKKGGEGIEDLPKLINWATEAISADLQKLLAFVIGKVNSLTSVIDKCYAIKMNEYGYYMAIEIPVDTVGEVDLEFFKDMLLLYRQYELYIRNIIHETSEIEDNIPNMYEAFDETLSDIHATVKFRTAVPVEDVFPLFWQLSECWENLQDTAVVLAKQNQIVMTLQSFVTQLSVDDQMLKSILGNEGAVYDVERLEQTPTISLCSFENLNSEISIMAPDDFNDFNRVSFEYMGFCAYKLVETNGGLIPGNPNIGVVVYNQKNYAFSTEDALKAWCTCPDGFIKQALQLARRKNELVKFLELEEDLRKVRKIGQLYLKPPIPVVMLEGEAQTDLHPIPSNIVPNYTHNIWDLKRQALYLANLLRCRSHSTQTSNSDKRTIRTQTYEHKEKVVQTKKDNYTNVPKPSNFIYGLRGRLDKKQFVITLTRPIKE